MIICCTRHRGYSFYKLCLPRLGPITPLYCIWMLNGLTLDTWHTPLTKNLSPDRELPKRSSIFVVHSIKNNLGALKRTLLSSLIVRIISQTDRPAWSISIACVTLSIFDWFTDFFFSFFCKLRTITDWGKLPAEDLWPHLGECEREWIYILNGNITFPFPRSTNCLWVTINTDTVKASP